MNELEKRARKENKTIVEQSKTVHSTEEFEKLKAEIAEEGGEIVRTTPLKKDAFTIQYRTLKD